MRLSPSLNKDLKEQIQEFGSKGETYSEIITRLIKSAKERLLQTAISNIHPDFRNERILTVFVFTIRDYYKRRADSTEKEQFQKEIDELYKLIYEELRKSKKFTLLDDISDIRVLGKLFD